MIAELDRYQGVVFRQLFLALKRRATIEAADIAGRRDAYYLNETAFQIKYSTKRLPPWQFTYQPENLRELQELRARTTVVWVFLVCGIDGVVGLSYDELMSIVQTGAGGVAWVRISRYRNAMYRVSGAAGLLARAKPRGVQSFASLAESKSVPERIAEL